MSFTASIPEPPCTDPDLPDELEDMLHAFWKSIPPGAKPTMPQLRVLETRILEGEGAGEDQATEGLG